MCNIFPTNVFTYKSKDGKTVIIREAIEFGEPLDKAVCREFLEDTGVVIRHVGITGVYFNATKHVLSVVFKAEYVSGEIKIQPEEIKEARFIGINESNIEQSALFRYKIRNNINRLLNLNGNNLNKINLNPSIDRIFFLIKSRKSEDTIELVLGNMGSS